MIAYYYCGDKVQDVGLTWSHINSLTDVIEYLNLIMVRSTQFPFQFIVQIYAYLSR